MTRDEQFMQLALAEAQKAAQNGEVPVGCVIVHRDQVIAVGRNRREKGKSALAHAEIVAIRRACRALGGWRLWECELYVTLEPCPMCAGAILNARIPKVVFGAADEKAGAMGSVFDLFSFPLNHKPLVVSGVCAEESKALLQAFFQKLRKRQEKRWKKPTE
ncbi:MAG TPA: nucleoside deaminase [Clostridiales bacterium]|nr:nucleoside deaminase [Clostridiales bacterium]